MARGFHWFVAWRYLMARPRKVSAAILAVAGTLLIGSVFASVTAKLVLSGDPTDGVISGWAYRNALVGAVGLGAVGVFGLFVGVVRHAIAEQRRIIVPIAATGGLLLMAIGASMVGVANRATHVTGVILVGAGAPAFAAAIAIYVYRTGRRAVPPLVFALLMAAAAAALVEVARYGLKPPAPLSMSFRPDRVFLPSAGLLLLGVASAAAILLRGQLNRALASVSLILILGSVVYARAATSMLLEVELLQTEPTGARYASYVLVGGLALLGLGALSAMLVPVERWGDRGSLRRWVTAITVSLWGTVALARAVTRLAKVLVAVGYGAPRMSRWHRFLMHVAVMSLWTGALGLLAARFVLTPPPLVFIPPGEQSTYTVFSLVAAILLALAELTVVLGVIRYFFTFFTSVSVAGVTVGSMALVIVLSVMSGFESDLRKKILGSNAHVLITKEEGKFTEFRQVENQIADTRGVLGTTPFLTSEVVIAANSNYSNVIIKGIEPETVGEVTDLDENVNQPRALEKLWPLAPDGGIVGPPPDAGVDAPDVAGAEPADGAPRSQEGADAGAGAAGGARDAGVVDPAPADMDVDIEIPDDFGEGYVPPPPDAAAPDVVDPAPADMDVDIDSPEDFGEGYVPPPDAGVEPGHVAPMVGASGDIPRLSGELPGDEQGIDGEEPPDDPFEIANLEDLDVMDMEEPPPPPVPARVAVLPGVLVGRELVKQLHLYVGQEVRIISPLEKNTPAGPVPRTRFLRVAGTFFTGMYEYDLKFVYVTLPSLQAFLDMYDEVSGIEVRVRNPDDTTAVVERLRARLAQPPTRADLNTVLNAMRDPYPGSALAKQIHVLDTVAERARPTYRVQDWKEINRNLFSALKLEKIAMFLVLVIIILVASFSIITNLIMVVIEKAREIAQLKTLGASDGGILRVFVAQGFFIGVCGTIVGVAHGLLACLLLLTFGFPLNPEVYYIDKLPVHVETGAVLAVVGAGILISVVATIYPAMVGARMRPIDGLRYE